MFVTPALIECVQAGIANGGRIHFAVSVDGGTAETHDWMRGRGSFKGTMRGLRLLSEAGLPADIQCVVHHGNWHTVPDLVAIAEELGIAFLKFVLATPVGRATEHTDELAWRFEEIPAALDTILAAVADYPGKVVLKVPPAWVPPSRRAAVGRLRENGCQILSATSCAFPLLGVLNDGSVTICAQTRDSAEAYFGNIRDLTLEQIWEQQRLSEMREDYLASKLTGICAECIFNVECKGACRAHAFTESGTFDAPYPTCAQMDAEGHFPEYYKRSYVAGLHERLVTSC
jgi:radical SAM protein with 4Fe4S-binding SPASM domain